MNWRRGEKKLKPDFPWWLKGTKSDPGLIPLGWHPRAPWSRLLAKENTCVEGERLWVCPSLTAGLAWGSLWVAQSREVKPCLGSSNASPQTAQRTHLFLPWDTCQWGIGPNLPDLCPNLRLMNNVALLNFLTLSQTIPAIGLREALEKRLWLGFGCTA